MSIEFDAASDMEIDITELLIQVWENKLIVLFFISMFGLAAVAYALTLPNIYKSEAVLVPVSKAKESGLSSIVSQYGGLAAMAGVSLSPSSVNNTVMGIEVAKSRVFFESFISKRGVLVDLMASKNWDRATQTLEIDPKIYDYKNKKWVREVKPPMTPQPSLQEAHERFLSALNMREDKETGLVKISIEHKSPVVAKRWVDWIVVDINERLRGQDVQEAERSIDYLKKQIESTSYAELRGGLFELIKKQTETIMLAKSRPEYLFKVIDPAVVPEKKFKPKRSFIVLGALAVGGLVGVAVVIMKVARKKLWHG